MADNLGSAQNCPLFGGVHCWEVSLKYSKFKRCWLYQAMQAFSDRKSKEYRLYSEEENLQYQMQYHNKRLQETLSVKIVCDQCLIVRTNTYPFNGCYDVISSVLQVVIFIISSKEMHFIKKSQCLFGIYYLDELLFCNSSLPVNFTYINFLGCC